VSWSLSRAIASDSLAMFVRRAMELALAVPVDARAADKHTQITAACAARGAEAGCSAGDASADADEGWITAGSLRAQRAAARNGAAVASAADVAPTTAAPPSQAEILFSTDISTGLPAAPAPASPLDLAAAAAELLDMGFDSDRVEVGPPDAGGSVCALPCRRNILQAALAACGSRAGAGDSGVVQAAVTWLMDN
jgi:hypothetical protein